MNWEADTAAHVVDQLEKAWETRRLRVGDRLDEPVCGVGQIQFVSGDEATPTLSIGGVAHRFDVLILAVGFGVEVPPFGLSYWSDDDLGAAEHERKDQRWLVSGIGDGALTDLMRLCIRDFQHAKVLAAVDDTTRETVGADLFRAEHGSKADREQAYRHAAQQVDPDLKKAIGFRSIGSVQLNDRSRELFEPQSSILNRLITAWLLENNRFEIVSGDLDRTEQNKDGRAIDVLFKIVLPSPWIGWSSDTVRSDRWTRIPGSPMSRLARVTRTDGVSRANRTIGRESRTTATCLLRREELPSSRLRVDFGNDIGCVVVTGHDEITEPDLAARVGAGAGASARLRRAPSATRRDGR